jgi:hypothetical protein
MTILPLEQSTELGTSNLLLQQPTARETRNIYLFFSIADVLTAAWMRSQRYRLLCCRPSSCQLRLHTTLFEIGYLEV